MDEARKEYLRIGGVADDFSKAYDKAREEILADLHDPEFVRLVNRTAREFAEAVFPTPKADALKRHPSVNPGVNPEEIRARLIFSRFEIVCVVLMILVDERGFEPPCRRVESRLCSLPGVYQSGPWPGVFFLALHIPA
jgi:hypothetical protein